MKRSGVALTFYRLFHFKKKSVLFVFAVYSIEALFLCVLSKGRKYLKRQQSLSPFAQLKPMFRMLHSSHRCNARKQYPNASTFSVPWFHQHGPCTKDVWTLNTCKSPTVSILGCTVYEIFYQQHSNHGNTECAELLTQEQEQSLHFAHWCIYMKTEKLFCISMILLQSWEISTSMEKQWKKHSTTWPRKTL